MGGVTTSALVVNWFDQSRARALGISLMGVSLSGMVMAHVATWLVQSGGWRETYEIFGWIVLGIAPLVFLTAVGKPEDKGLRAYGAEEGASDASAPDPTSDFPSGERRTEWTTLEALHEPNLWVISIVAGLTFMGTTGIMTHILAFGTDSGLDSTSAAWLLSMLAGGAVAGKLVFGWLADRLGERPALIVSLVMQILAFAVLTAGSGFWPLIAICTFLGLGVGGAMQLAVALLARAFGPAVFGQMMGLMMPLMIPFQSMGAPLAGFIFDKTGSYVLAFWVFSAALTAAAILLSFLRLPDEQPRPVSELAIEAG
jgi:MFS family permease